MNNNFRCKIYTRDNIYFITQEDYACLKKSIEYKNIFFTFIKYGQEISLNLSCIEKIEVCNEETNIIKGENAIYDVISYILKLEPDIQQMKLHKMLFYIEGWGLAQDYHFFDDEIKVGLSGPLIEAILSNSFIIKNDTYPKGNINNLTIKEKKFIECCVETYRKYSAADMYTFTVRENLIKNILDSAASFTDRIIIDKLKLKDYFKQRLLRANLKKKRSII